MKGATHNKVEVDGRVARSIKRDVPDSYRQDFYGKHAYPVEIDGTFCGFLAFHTGGGFGRGRTAPGWVAYALVRELGHFGTPSIFNPVPNPGAHRRLIQFGSGYSWGPSDALRIMLKKRLEGELPSIEEAPAWEDEAERKRVEFNAKMAATDAALKERYRLAREEAHARQRAKDDALTAERREIEEGLRSILAREQGLGLSNFETAALQRAIEHFQPARERILESGR